MKERPGFMLYFDLVDALSSMEDDEAGRLFKALMAYARYGEVRELTGLAAFAFDVVRPRIDRDAEAYAEKCRKSAYAAYLGAAKRRGEPVVEYEHWDGADACERMPTQRSSNSNHKNSSSAKQHSAGSHPLPESELAWMKPYIKQRDKNRAPAER